MFYRPKFSAFFFNTSIGNQIKSLCSFQHFTVVDWIYSRSYCSQFTRLALSNLTSRFLNVRDTTKRSSLNRYLACPIGKTVACQIRMSIAYIAHYKDNSLDIDHYRYFLFMRHFCSTQLTITSTITQIETVGTISHTSITTHVYVPYRP